MPIKKMMYKGEAVKTVSNARRAWCILRYLIIRALQDWPVPVHLSSEGEDTLIYAFSFYGGI